MTKTFTQVALCTSLLGMMTSTVVTKAGADSFQNESGKISSVQTNTENSRIEIPAFSSGRGDIKVELGVVDGEVHVYTNFNLNAPNYYSAKLFTHEDGVEERSTAISSFKTKFCFE